MRFLFVIQLVVLTLLVSACGGGSSTFSLVGETDTFTQSTDTVNNKVDIIWMVDASGTMVNHQNNLASNFDNFIAGFVNKNIDYNMVVASTDAWVREYNYNAGGCGPNRNPSEDPNTIYVSSADCAATLATYGDLTKFRDGNIYGAVGGGATPRSGTYLLTSLLDPTLVVSTFATNVRTGTRGDGVAESGFASLRSVLRRNDDGTVGYGGETHSVLSTFRRPDAFLAVIIVSDEEDQGLSQNKVAYVTDQDYVDAFVGFLDGYTGGVVGDRNYNVSSVVMPDINDCSYGLDPQATQGDRYVAISNATNGVVANICSADFSNDLDKISGQILSLASRFQLSRIPIPETIVVKVNDAVVTQNAVNGWTYEVASGFHYVQFHGTAIPPKGASISVVFDPAIYGG